MAFFSEFPSDGLWAAAYWSTSMWKPMGIAESVYYPIAVVAGVIAAVGFLALFLKKSAKYKTSTLAQ